MAPGSVNKVTLLGNLVKDPEIRRTTNGKLAAVLNVATSDYWRPGTARTQWHRVVIFNKRLAELAQRHLKKGSKAYIEGALETRKWLSKSGGESWTAEVIVSGFHGRLTLLDDDAREEQETLADEPALASPPTLSIKRSSAKHGDGADINTIDAGLPWLAQPKEQTQ